MRLGISSPLSHSSPEEWAEKQTDLGCTAVVFPLSCNDSEEKIKAYKKAADEKGLMIAEVGIWRNALSSDPDERKRNIDHSVGQLKLADSLGARCAVNVAGSRGKRWDGGYRDNFSDEVFELTVKTVREIIDRAEITNTYFTLEPMPWMIPTGPEEYLKLIEAVNRERFAVHLDIINMINSADRYFSPEKFTDRCVSLLGDRIRSCHIKDVHLKEEFTLQLEECAPGMGEFPLRHYAEALDKADCEMPVILEHLDSDEEYITYFNYLKEELNGLYKIIRCQ
ncbi:MAG: sugar phosphate isomerase/epimerase [Oscillospiraceae bacterium]|nr:sugar phosphate isomerase/epimerase [Oscillospiraceae bacterium]